MNGKERASTHTTVLHDQRAFKVEGLAAAEVFDAGAGISSKG